MNRFIPNHSRFLKVFLWKSFMTIAYQITLYFAFLLNPYFCASVFKTSILTNIPYLYLHNILHFYLTVFLCKCVTSQLILTIFPYLILIFRVFSVTRTCVESGLTSMTSPCTPMLSIEEVVKLFLPLGVYYMHLLWPQNLDWWNPCILWRFRLLLIFVNIFFVYFG